MDKLSVLLVEDNMDDEWLALRTMRKLGLKQVTVARDGCAALSELAAAGLQGEDFLPDLVLLDLKLPKLDGIDVLRRLRGEAATSGLNVAILSSSEDPHALAICRSLGVLACSQKPLTTESLGAILQLLPRQIDQAVGG